MTARIGWVKCNPDMTPGELLKTAFEASNQLGAAKKRCFTIINSVNHSNPPELKVNLGHVTVPENCQVLPGFEKYGSDILLAVNSGFQVEKVEYIIMISFDFVTRQLITIEFRDDKFEGLFKRFIVNEDVSCDCNNCQCHA